MDRVPGKDVKRKRAAASSSNDTEATPNSDPEAAQSGADRTEKGDAAAEQVRACVLLLLLAKAQLSLRVEAWMKWMKNPACPAKAYRTLERSKSRGSCRIG